MSFELLAVSIPASVQRAQQARAKTNLTPSAAVAQQTEPASFRQSQVPGPGGVGAGQTYLCKCFLSCFARISFVSSALLHAAGGCSLSATHYSAMYETNPPHVTLLFGVRHDVGWIRTAIFPND